jgi:hypothetical protein
MNTRAARVCSYPLVGALVALTMSGVADAGPADVQCYSTTLGPLCLDLGQFPWLTASTTGEICLVTPPQRPPPQCTNPAVPANAVVPTRSPNGEWSAVPVGQLPPPLSGGGQWPPPLPRDQWPTLGPGYQGTGLAAAVPSPGGLMVPTLPQVPSQPSPGLTGNP